MHTPAWLSSLAIVVSLVTVSSDSISWRREWETRLKCRGNLGYPACMSLSVFKSGHSVISAYSSNDNHIGISWWWIMSVICSWRRNWWNPDLKLYRLECTSPYKAAWKPLHTNQMWAVLNDEWSPSLTNLLCISYEIQAFYGTSLEVGAYSMASLVSVLPCAFFGSSYWQELRIAHPSYDRQLFRSYSTIHTENLELNMQSPHV